MSDTLDIRHLKETGYELKKRIVEMVSATQSPLLIVPLPDVILMTKAQYDELDPHEEVETAYKSHDRLYVTPLNAMNIAVRE